MNERAQPSFSSRLLTGYYGLLQVVHLFVLAYGLNVYIQSGTIGFPAPPPRPGTECILGPRQSPDRRPCSYRNGRTECLRFLVSSSLLTHSTIKTDRTSSGRGRGTAGGSVYMGGRGYWSRPLMYPSIAEISFVAFFWSSFCISYPTPDSRKGSYAKIFP